MLCTMSCLIKLGRITTGNYNKLYQTAYTSMRTVYSDASMGIQNYEATREKVNEQFLTFADKFKSKMEEFVKDGPTNMIFTEDLKNMIHICSRTDLDLVHKMITKFNTQNKEYRFGSFIFGPVVMRMYHYFNAPKEALEVFENPKNEGFFDQIVSYHLLLNLLYKNEMYDDMFRVFEYINKKQVQMLKYPKHSVVLILAACYKQNTVQSLNYASKLWSDLINVGHVPMRKGATFFAGLAINQGAPHIALEVLSILKQQQYFTVRNLKVIALADIGRVEDSLPILRSVLELDQPTVDKHTFVQEAIDKVKYALSQINEDILTREFQKLEHALRQRNLIEEKSLDSLLCQEVVQLPRDMLGKFNSHTERLHTSFHKGRRIPALQSRLGLNDRY